MKLFNSSVRLRRIDYFFHQIITFITLFFLVILSEYINELLDTDLLVSPLIFLIAFIVYLIFEIITIIKRLHDLNRPGSDLLYLLIPLYNIVFGLMLTFQEGSKGINNYGPDPRISENRSISKIIINYIIVITILIFGIWNIFQIKEKKQLRIVESFIESPVENSYLLVQSENPENLSYKYTLLRVSSITNDSITIHYCDYVFTTRSSANAEVPKSEVQFVTTFTFSDRYAISHLNELDIKEVVYK